MNTGRVPGTHLGPVQPPDRLAGFPARTYRSGTELFRCHQHGRGACWFSSSGTGRFDLAAAEGTCYLAEAELVTLLETFGGSRVIADYAVAGRDISRLRWGEDLRVADMTSNRAVGFGVTAEMFTTLDYEVTQLWAAGLRSAGFAGIRYWARHDLEHTAACLAVFGAAGAPPYGARTPWDTAGAEHLADRQDLVAAFQAATGIAVLPVPNLGAISGAGYSRQKAD
ncbi:RES family NAD+ phosphorylase [Mycolicibacter icosiumassiliensis]|uniref:RES family NAD+ phosphorylase n=1 Tax=Mycolicibacter icosiumassiliensis TaxID=1792835 RepID=UPI000B08447E|nr:RES family NAD+ phosphorylase [Mycolicibacter icosiumassiliensis]